MPPLVSESASGDAARLDHTHGDELVRPDRDDSQ